MDTNKLDYNNESMIAEKKSDTKHSSYLQFVYELGHTEKFDLDRQIFIEKDIRKKPQFNKLPYLVMPTKDGQYLLVGCSGMNLIQWNIQQKQLYIDYENMFFNTNSIEITHDNKYCFIGTREGNLIQWNIKKECITKNFALKYFAKFIQRMASTNDNKYQFVSSYKVGLQQQNIKQQKQMRIYDNLFGFETTIWAMAVTYDSKFLFVCGCSDYILNDNDVVKCTLKQIDIHSQKVIHDYEETDQNIGLMATTRDNRYLFTFTEKGHIKQWDIKEQTLYKDHGKAHKKRIQSIVITDDNRYLFTVDMRGGFKQWDIENAKQHKDYGIIHKKNEVYGMVMIKNYQEQKNK